MPLTKYGYDTIKIAAVVCLLLIVGGLLTNTVWLRILLLALAGFLLLFTLNFFRDPERVTPQGSELVISPADGKVIVIKNVQENRFINGPGVQVSVFMSPLNVHVNRIPVDGKVGYVRYVKGKYLAAFEDKASEENERSEIGIESANGKLLFTQVAGYVARRIVFELKEGQMVKKGERFGMIKFGSRVDIIVPAKWKINVKEGDIVRAGETVLFTSSEE